MSFGLDRGEFVRCWIGNFQTLPPQVTYTEANHRIIANNYYGFVTKENYRRPSMNKSSVPTRGWQPNLEWSEFRYLTIAAILLIVNEGKWCVPKAGNAGESVRMSRASEDNAE